MMTEKIFSLLITVLDKVIWTIDVGPQVHKFFLAPQLGNFRVYLGKVRAVMVYRYAIENVPAYKDFIAKHPHVGPRVSLRGASLNDVPEMDKASYIKQYSFVEKLVGGELPREGVMFDESSGSSGKPTSWVRGWRERRMTRRVMQVAFEKFIGKKDPIILNTFSMGAWATGFNTSTCLIEVGRVKSIGPDITKVVDTLLEFGPRYDYVILGYPPFLRLLAESKQIDWKKYKIDAVYGGEGLSETMREYLEKYFQEVVGSYGASDLEINIAHESDLTIALRKQLAKDEKLRALLLRDNHGILPMVFQYNPYDYLFETNEKGELLVTICRKYNLSPRVRYNIHDLGHTLDFYKLKKLLADNGYGKLLEKAEFDFGLLFHYGRSDLSVDYNGAVVGPEEVRQIIENSEFAKAVNTFRLVSYEDESAKKHLLFAVETMTEKNMEEADQKKLLAIIVEGLSLSNLDFKSAHSTAQLKPELRAYAHMTGLFDAAHTKLKNDYIWNIDSARAKSEGII